MFPNYYIHEYLLFERHQELQREMAELRRLSGVHRHHSSVVPRLAAKLGVLLVMLGTRLRRLEPSGKHGVYDQSNT
jgi:hypothetical protein